jgi:4-amino-4-deoxy-L-arabinose transferase-like glycosyltransferase
MGGLSPAVWAFAFTKVLLHVATTRLSFHRDELYFIAASKRLAASYVDFQPATPVLVRVFGTVFGDSLIGVRLIPALAGALVVLLAALLAKELGGDRRAQAFAAFTALVIPIFVGANSALNTVSLEIPAWMIVALLLARTERTNDPRNWTLVGIAIGVALLVKFTVLAYLVGIPIAVALTSLRRHLRTPWPWAGALIAVAIVAPSLIWQAQHSFPVAEFVQHQSGGGKVLGLSGRLGYVASLVIFPGPIGLFLLIPGLRWLFGEASRRAIALATVVPLAVFLIAGGKGYYASPALAVAFVAGAVAVVEKRDSVPRWLVVALVINLLVPLPLLVPVVPTSVLAKSEDLAQATELGERLGWEDLARSTREALDGLSTSDQQRAVVIGANYAIPAAIEYYEERYDLPAAVSGHNSAYLWWPDQPDDHIAVLIGFDDPEVERIYADVERVGTVRNDEGVHNYEWEDPIHVGRDARYGWEEIHRRLKNFTA